VRFPRTRLARTRVASWPQSPFRSQAMPHRHRPHGRRSRRPGLRADAATALPAAVPPMVRQAIRCLCSPSLSPSSEFPWDHPTEDRSLRRYSPARVIRVRLTSPSQHQGHEPCRSARPSRQMPSAAARRQSTTTPKRPASRVGGVAAREFGPIARRARRWGRVDEPIPSPAMARLPLHVTQTRFPPVAPTKRDKRRSSTLCTRFKRDAIVPVEHPRIPAISS